MILNIDLLIIGKVCWVISYLKSLLFVENWFKSHSIDKFIGGGGFSLHSILIQSKKFILLISPTTQFSFYLIIYHFRYFVFLRHLHCIGNRWFVAPHYLWQYNFHLKHKRSGVSLILHPPPSPTRKKDFLLFRHIES